MDPATINLWLDQAEHDEVISPGFRPQVERKLLDLRARLAEAEDWRADVENAMAGAMDERCDLSERHCTCVPLLRAKVAEAEAALAKDRISLVGWMLRHVDEDGCFTGDCPHELNSECIQSIVQQYEEDEAAKEAQP